MQYDELNTAALVGGSVLLKPIHTQHAVPLIHTCNAAPLPCSDSVMSFVKFRVVPGNIRTASPTV